MTINEFYSALNSTTFAKDAEFSVEQHEGANRLTIKNAEGKERHFTVPSGGDKAQVLSVRQALAAAIQAELGEKALAAVKTQLLGEDGAQGTEKLTPLAARKIIDIARAADKARVEARISTMLTSTRFPKGVMAFLTNTVKENPSNAVVASFLAGKPRNVEGLIRLAALAVTIHVETPTMPVEDRLALAYLRGFGSLAETFEKNPVPSHAQVESTKVPEVTQQEKKGKVDATSELATQKKVEKLLALAPDKVPASVDELKTSIGQVAKQITDPVLADEKKQDGATHACTFIVPKLGQFEFSRTSNGGGGKDNCFFLSTLTNLGLPATNRNSFALRILFQKEMERLLENLEKTHISFSPAEKPGQLDHYCLRSKDTKGDAPGLQLDELFNYHLHTEGADPSKGVMADVSHGALLAHLAQRPVVIILPAEQGKATAQQFDIDLQTGEKIAGEPLYIQYDEAKKHFEALQLVKKGPAPVEWTPLQQLVDLKQTDLVANQDAKELWDNEQAVKTLSEKVQRLLDGANGGFQPKDLMAKLLNQDNRAAAVTAFTAYLEALAAAGGDSAKITEAGETLDAILKTLIPEAYQQITAQK